jgi:hypothetical protein
MLDNILQVYCILEQKTEVEALYNLKRQYHEILTSGVFHKSTDHRPLINHLKYFSNSFQFHVDMGKKKLTLRYAT